MPEEVPTRPLVSKSNIESVMAWLRGQLERRLEKHGHGAYASSHEIAGVMLEEWNEYQRELQMNNRWGQCDELFDMAVTAVFGIASVETVYPDDRKHYWR